jgi:hypothetical protein
MTTMINSIGYTTSLADKLPNDSVAKSYKYLSYNNIAMASLGILSVVLVFIYEKCWFFVPVTERHPYYEDVEDISPGILGRVGDDIGNDSFFHTRRLESLVP